MKSKRILIVVLEFWSSQETTGTSTDLLGTDKWTDSILASPNRATGDKKLHYKGSLIRDVG